MVSEILKQVGDVYGYQSFEEKMFYNCLENYFLYPVIIYCRMVKVFHTKFPVFKKHILFQYLNPIQIKTKILLAQNY